MCGSSTRATAASFFKQLPWFAVCRLRRCGRAAASPSILKNVKQAIGSALIARGLQEAGENEPDVYVGFSIESQEYVVGSGGRANPLVAPAGRGGRGSRGGRGGDPVSAGAPDFSDAGLVIDLIASQPSELLIWRGVFRDRERDVSKLVERLPANARKLLSDYPPKRRRHAVNGARASRTALPEAVCAAS
jgi:hypothetical protein